MHVVISTRFLLSLLYILQLNDWEKTQLSSREEGEKGIPLVILSIIVEFLRPRLYLTGNYLL